MLCDRNVLLPRYVSRFSIARKLRKLEGLRDNKGLRKLSPLET